MSPLRLALPLWMMTVMGIVLPGGGAWARATASYYYPLEAVYSTVLRFVRIDRGCTITDRDPQAAFVLFECKEGNARHRGALELFKSGDAVRVQLVMADDPSYIEIRFVEQLSRKLKDEHGPSVPRPARPAERPPESPDGGARP